MKSTTRIKQTGEVFTPTSLVNEILEKLPQELITDPTKTILDPACGNGQFLIEVVKKRNSIKNVFGVDIMADNCCDTIARLLFYVLFDEHIIGDNATFNPLTRIEGLDNHDNHLYNDNHTYEWLKHETTYERVYVHHNHFIIVRKAYNSNTGCWFEYSTDDINYHLYPYVSCADSLTFDYNEFDNILTQNKEKILWVEKNNKSFI